MSIEKHWLQTRLMLVSLRARRRDERVSEYTPRNTRAHGPGTFVQWSATLNRNLPMDAAYDESPGAHIEKLGLVLLSYLNLDSHESSEFQAAGTCARR